MSTHVLFLLPRLSGHASCHEAHARTSGHLQCVHCRGGREFPQHTPTGQHCMLPHQLARHLRSTGIWERDRIVGESHWFSLQFKSRWSVTGQSVCGQLVWSVSVVSQCGQSVWSVSVVS